MLYFTWTVGVYPSDWRNKRQRESNGCKETPVFTPVKFIMLITKEQAEARLNSPDNLANQVVRNNSHFEIVKINHGGREQGRATDLTEQERATIGALAHLDTAKNIAREFGISRQHVENLKFGRVGARGGDEKEHPELKSKLGQKLEQVRDVALDKLMESLGLITQENLSECDAKDLSGIAANMSKVVEKTLPKQDGSQGVKIQIYAPQLKEIDQFKLVEV